MYYIYLIYKIFLKIRQCGLGFSSCIILDMSEKSLASSEPQIFTIKWDYNMLLLE